MKYSDLSRTVINYFLKNVNLSVTSYLHIGGSFVLVQFFTLYFLLKYLRSVGPISVSARWSEEPLGYLFVTKQILGKISLPTTRLSVRIEEAFESFPHLKLTITGSRMIIVSPFNYFSHA